MDIHVLGFGRKDHCHHGSVRKELIARIAQLFPARQALGVSDRKMPKPFLKTDEYVEPVLALPAFAMLKACGRIDALPTQLDLFPACHQFSSFPRER